MTALVDRLAAGLGRRSSRRGFLVRATLVGTAVSVAPLDYLLRPGTAYGSICGSGSTCSSGWTAFCCTVNDGQNRCPPGTIAGGWWKADNSSFCCSGGRPQPRYYIDCNAECTHCRSGCGTFCDTGCVDCSCRCANEAGSCDQRRTCCNVFRYGQCHQEVACVGPVACRMVSCTPPWEFFGECDPSSATDDNTVTHSAPCLEPPCR